MDIDDIIDNLIEQGEFNLTDQEAQDYLDNFDPMHLEIIKESVDIANATKGYYNDWKRDLVSKYTARKFVSDDEINIIVSKIFSEVDKVYEIIDRVRTIFAQFPINHVILIYFYTTMLDFKKKKKRRKNDNRTIF